MRRCISHIPSQDLEDIDGIKSLFSFMYPGKCAGSLEFTATRMPSTDANKMPNAFSGGERQRIGIARALAYRPEFIFCDEPTSALDVSVQADLLNLLKDLQEQLSLTLLFVSHDLAVIRQMCDRVIVMKDGKVVEAGDNEAIFTQPQAQYTQSLLEAMPRFDRVGSV